MNKTEKNTVGEEISEETPAIGSLSEPVPWDSPVDGDQLLRALVRGFNHHLSLPPGADVASALWALHTYAIDSFHISPLLGVVSPAPRCGKTSFLTFMSWITPKPFIASNSTAAAIHHLVDAHRPTLFLDEFETYSKGNEALRGILNSGHTRSGAWVLRAAKSYSTWCPKVMSLIGMPSTTLADRSILIPMRRSKPGERKTPLDLHALENGHLETLRQMAKRWALDNAGFITPQTATVPEEITSDRARDNWRVLLSIADAIGGEWSELARNAAVVLNARRKEQYSPAELVLADIKSLFDERQVEDLETSEILSHLAQLDYRVWGTWRRGQSITAAALSELLGDNSFDIHPRKWRIGLRTARGYWRQDFEDAFSRYVPLSEPNTPPQAATYATSQPYPMQPALSAVGH